MATTVEVIANEAHTTSEYGTVAVPTGARYAQIVVNISDIGADELTPIASIVADSTPYQYKRVPLLTRADTFTMELLPVFEGDVLRVDVLIGDVSNFVYGVDVTFIP